MKTILIATDFSDASLNAFLYSVSLAGQLKANVHLYHVYKMIQEIPESYLVHTQPDLWPVIKEKLETVIRSLKPHPAVEISYSGDHGPVAECILKEAGRVNADMIVCGMKHRAGDLRQIFGSIATVVARKTKLPVLIVPHKAVFTPLKHAALACDIDPETHPATVKILSALIRNSSADLSVVLVSTDAATAKYEMHFHTFPFMTALKELHPVFEISEGKDITRSLLHFAREKAIGLLAVIAHHHSVFDRLIVESVTRKLTFHTHIPLLVLPRIIAADLSEKVHQQAQTEQTKS